MTDTPITPLVELSAVDEPAFDDFLDAHTWNPLPATWRSPCRSPREMVAVVIADNGHAVTYDDSATSMRDESSTSTDHHRLAVSAATVLVEILQGRRPLTQAARLCSEPASTALADHFARLPWAKARLAGVRESSPREGTVEAAVRLAMSGRYLAAALCLEASEGRWLCTQFDILYPGWAR